MTTKQTATVQISPEELRNLLVIRDVAIELCAMLDAEKAVSRVIELRVPYPEDHGIDPTAIDAAAIGIIDEDATE